MVTALDQTGLGLGVRLMVSDDGDERTAAAAASSSSSSPSSPSSPSSSSSSFSFRMVPRSTRFLVSECWTVYYNHCTAASIFPCVMESGAIISWPCPHLVYGWAFLCFYNLPHSTPLRRPCGMVRFGSETGTLNRRRWSSKHAAQHLHHGMTFNNTNKQNNTAMSCHAMPWHVLYVTHWTAHS